MDIKDLLGDAFVEDMSIEDINNALKDKTFVDPSTLPKSVEKSMFDKKTSELAAVKKELEEMKKSSMSEEERIKLALEEASKTKAEFLKKSAKLDVEKVLVEGGLSSKDYGSIIDSLVSEDSAESVGRAKALVDMMNTQKSVIREQLKKEMRDSLPAHPTGKSEENKSQDDFNKMSLTEKMKFKAENPEEFNMLLNGGN